MCMTPDGLPLVGPLLQNHNYWVALGFFDELGSAVGVGKFLAEWIAEKEPPFELAEIEPERFRSWADREVYSNYYAEDRPLALRPSGRPTVRVSGAHGPLMNHGAKMEKYCFSLLFHNGAIFVSVEREYRLITEKCAIIDLSFLSIIEVRGKMAEQFLNYVLAKRAPEAGKAIYSCMLTPTGKILSQMKVMRHNMLNSFLLVSGAEQEARNLRWLNFTSNENKFFAEVTNVSRFLSTLSLVGPKAFEIMKKVTPANMSYEAFPHMSSKPIKIGKVPAIVCRMSFTGEPGFEIYHNRAETLRVYDELMTAGKAFGIKDAGWEALNILRTEKGMKFPEYEVRLSVRLFLVLIVFILLARFSAHCSRHVNG
ncbi:unnamed protein product [Soboliphyme baturini]|uniref:GCV_T domain-containing protein n=1 Tax=Soboliphyme baturini TaxID=241478 RepID=A0A183IH70_9BILA|nr:unnamed protein product [Soboliphyme baturini]